FVQHARQQAGLNCIGFVLMVLRVDSKLATNDGPDLGVDQRPTPSGVELVTDVDRVRQQSVDVPAREGFAAAGMPLAVVLHFVPSRRREYELAQGSEICRKDHKKGALSQI